MKRYTLTLLIIVSATLTASNQASAGIGSFIKKFAPVIVPVIAATTLAVAPKEVPKIVTTTINKTTDIVKEAAKDVKKASAEALKDIKEESKKGFDQLTHNPLQAIGDTIEATTALTVIVPTIFVVEAVANPEDLMEDTEGTLKKDVRKVVAAINGGRDDTLEEMDRSIDDAIENGFLPKIDNEGFVIGTTINGDGSLSFDSSVSQGTQNYINEKYQSKQEFSKNFQEYYNDFTYRFEEYLNEFIDTDPLNNQAPSEQNKLKTRADILAYKSLTGTYLLLAEKLSQNSSKTNKLNLTALKKSLSYQEKSIELLEALNSPQIGHLNAEENLKLSYKLIAEHSRNPAAIETPIELASLVVGLDAIDHWSTQTGLIEKIFDVVGVVGDGAAVALPGIPGGISILFKSTEAAGKFKKVLDSARKLGLKTKEGIKRLAGFKQQKQALEGATDAAKHELYKKQLRQSMTKPDVQDKKLFEIIDDNYRPNAKVGSGSTADALRYEKLTGNPVGGKRHAIKAREQVTRVQRWLDKNPNTSAADRSGAEQVMLDLMDALGDI